MSGQVRFLVLHGGLVWPVVGALLVTLAAAVAWAFARRRRVRSVQDALTGASPRVRVAVPVIVALVAAPVYYSAVSALGDSLLDEASSTPKRLLWATATPKRQAALARFRDTLTDARLRPDALATRQAIAGLLGDCEGAVEDQLFASHLEETLRLAARCPPSAKLWAMVEQAHLGLGQLDQAADALERRRQLAGTREWDSGDLSLLIMTRRWATFERAARDRAAAAKPRSAEAEAWSCVALGARLRAGDTSAMTELRARPVEGGSAVCRLIVADATGALEDVQAIAPRPVQPGDLRQGRAEIPRRGDLQARYDGFLAAVLGKGDGKPPAYAIAPAPPMPKNQAFLAPPSLGTELGPLDQLRELVLVTRAPGATSNFWRNWRHYETEPGAMLRGEPPSIFVGMILRAARSLDGRGAAGEGTARVAVEILSHAAITLASVGQHEAAEAYLELAVDLEASLPFTRDDDGDPRGDEVAKLGYDLIGLRLRQGRFDEGIAVAKAMAAMDPWVKRYNHTTAHDRVEAYVSLVGGGLYQGHIDYLYMRRDAREAMSHGLGGNPDRILALDPYGLDDLREDLPLVARRMGPRRAELRPMLATFPLDPRTPFGWFAELGHRLHLAEALDAQAEAAALRPRLATYLDALTDDETALLLALVGLL